jgi:alginate O-acetyltransferase complex protein AlgI
MGLSFFIQAPRLRQLLMLIASYAFYVTWGTGFLSILILSSVLNFYTAEFLKRRRTLVRLWFGVAGNVLLLAFFKYLPGFVSSSQPWLHGLAMPIGMSFWTFQALSFLFDVYREEDLDPSLMEFCLYMAFWPTVMMGPICRLTRMLPQFRQPQRVARKDVSMALQRIGIGLFMKLVVAQLLASSMDTAGVGAGHTLSTLGGLDVWFIAIGFGFQLFFDFAGYSHIVIGISQLFGIVLQENFDSPFLATTPSMFWTKWHMSLSFWIRDYVFMPLATLRREVWWRYSALVISMLLFGLWHGATWTFALWGLYHGLVQVVQRVRQQRRGNTSLEQGLLDIIAAWAVTFVSISFSWILFRAKDLAEAVGMLKAVFTPTSYLYLSLPREYCWVVLLVGTAYFSYATIVQSGKMTQWIEAVLADAPNSIGPQWIWRWLWEQRLWWLTPMIAVVTLCAGVAVLLETSRVTSFIYTVF